MSNLKSKYNNFLNPFLYEKIIKGFEKFIDSYTKKIHNMKLSKILTTPIGTFLKGFTSIVLAMWVSELTQGHDLFSMDVAMIKKLIVAGIVPNIHVLINWINPEYKQYGESKEK